MVEQLSTENLLRRSPGEINRGAADVAIIGDNRAAAASVASFSTDPFFRLSSSSSSSQFQRTNGRSLSILSSKKARLSVEATTRDNTAHDIFKQVARTKVSPRTRMPEELCRVGHEHRGGDGGGLRRVRRGQRCRERRSNRNPILFCCP